MGKRTTYLAAFSALALALSGTSAAAADNLDCMTRPFEGKDKEFLDNFVHSFKLEEWGATGGGPDLAALMDARTALCASEFGWSEGAGNSAFMWRAGVLLEEALEATGPLSAGDVALLEASFDAADQTVLFRAMGPQIDPDYFGTAEPTDEDLLYLGGVLEKSGVPVTDETATFTGALVAARLTQTHWASVFAKN